MKEPSETATRPTIPPQQNDPKNKGKGKMVKQEKPLKKKDQIKFHKEIAQRLQLAARLQAEEQGELTIEEKSRLFVELMDKRKKHFARLRAEVVKDRAEGSKTRVEGSSKRAGEDLQQYLTKNNK
ncbi:hypothetical protein Tco_0598862 [Tanacetum coccineum]